VTVTVAILDSGPSQHGRRSAGIIVTHDSDPRHPNNRLLASAPRRLPLSSWHGNHSRETLRGKERSLISAKIQGLLVSEREGRIFTFWTEIIREFHGSYSRSRPQKIYFSNITARKSEGPNPTPSTQYPNSNPTWGLGIREQELLNSS
jgi:hypothetical protein